MKFWQLRERCLSYPEDKNATSSGSGTRPSSRDRALTNNRTAPAVSKMIEQLAGDWIDVKPNHAGYTQRYHLTVTDRDRVDRGVHVDTYLDPWKLHETASRSSPNLIHVLSDGAGESVVWRGSNLRTRELITKPIGRGFFKIDYRVSPQEKPITNPKRSPPDWFG